MAVVEAPRTRNENALALPLQYNKENAVNLEVLRERLIVNEI